MTVKTRTNTVRTAIVDITPAQAEEWLTANTHNRPLRQNRVDALVGAIKRGEWVLNGDAIRFDTGGVLIDGQHRLWAAVLAETTIPALVVTGLASESQDTVDTGARRSLRDALALRGEPSATKLAAAINYWWRYQNGYVRHPQMRPTVQQALHTLEEHPDLREASRVSDRLRSRFHGSTGPMVSMIYEFSTLDSDSFEDFYDRLVEGYGLQQGSPVYALRRWLERQEGLMGARATATTFHALGIKAWNAYMRGEQVSTLSWRSTGVNAEPFPEAIGPLS